MTIKQQGGIFGRNPTFNDVNATDITTTNLDATDIDVTNIDTGTLHVATNIELTPASSTFGTAPAITHYTNGYVYMTGGTGGLILRDDGGAVGIQIQNDDYIKFETGNPAAEAARFNSSGNLAFPSGQGIDFSATSGTGTSELFDDYEEGTYTPALEGMTGGAVTYTSQFGRYTKIGRQVNVFFSITVNTNTNTGGNTRVSVPFVPDVGGSNYIYVGPIGINSTSNSSITHVSFFSGIAAALFFTPALGTLNGSAVTNGSVLSGSITYFV